MAPSGIPSLRLYGLSLSHDDPYASSLPTPPTPSTLATSTSSESNSTSEQSFTYPNNAMPLPGPEHYEARRARWLTPPAGSPRPRSPSTSRAKLEALLSQEGAIQSDDVWNSGVKSVWKGLVGGGRLRRRLPLAMVLKILQAGWLRDGTWPADSIRGPPSPTPPPSGLPVQVTSHSATSGGGHGGDDPQGILFKAEGAIV